MSDFQHTFIRTAKVLSINRNYAAKALWKVCVAKTNLMHYLSSVYFISQPLHVVLKSTTCTSCWIYTVYLLVMGYKYARNM